MVTVANTDVRYIGKLLRVNLKVLITRNFVSFFKIFVIVCLHEVDIS